jgi:acetylornithine deacetylase/succinyl-diaminopimelate desuccinylase-like protein
MKAASNKATLAGALAHVDTHADQAVADLQRLMRQASLTVDTSDCAACADLVADMLRESGFQARVVPAHHNPIVLAEGPQVAGRPTLLITGHYDVVEPGPREAWSSDPFGAVLHDGDILGRGAADPKGNFLAGVKAAQAFLATTGDTPLNIKWLDPSRRTPRPSDRSGTVAAG